MAPSNPRGSIEPRWRTTALRTWAPHASLDSNCTYSALLHAYMALDCRTPIPLPQYVGWRMHWIYLLICCRKRKLRPHRVSLHWRGVHRQDLEVRWRLRLQGWLGRRVRWVWWFVAKNELFVTLQWGIVIN